jgi:hypothetical protein
MDPITLSAGLVAVLARLLPFLTGMGEAAGNAAADSAGRAIGDAAVKRSTALWDRLWPKLRGETFARQAVTAVAKNPDGEHGRTMLARAIAPVLAQNPELAREATALLRQVRGTVNDIGKITVTGDGNVMQIGVNNISIGKARDVDIRNRNHQLPVCIHMPRLTNTLPVPNIHSGCATFS